MCGVIRRVRGVVMHEACLGGDQEDLVAHVDARDLD